jgi:hypothetical protein
MTSPLGENATSATGPACPRTNGSTRPSRESMISTWCAEQTASRVPSGENPIPRFGPKVIRTITSARPTSTMPDIMDLPIAGEQGRTRMWSRYRVAAATAVRQTTSLANPASSPGIPVMSARCC